jgi:AcrR family transcriptional regulator
MSAGEIRRGAHRAQRGKSKPSTPGRDSYHHGDLRAALLAAAESELAENGIEGFTLRGCARRAGVSHAAPAHHFKDVRALLTELAADGFERLAEITERFGSAAPLGTLEHIVETGRGYVSFAASYPNHFGLIFRMDRLNRENERYLKAGAAAFRVPVEGVGAYYGSSDPMSDPELAARVIGIWSIVHGFSVLMLAGQFDGQAGGNRQALIDHLIPTIVRQCFPSPAKGGKSSGADRKRPPTKTPPG